MKSYTEGQLILIGILFFLAGLLSGLLFPQIKSQIVLPFVVKPTCTPRPPCLDATPRCLISETSDMCPPTVTPSVRLTPTPSTSTYTDNLKRFSLQIPIDWKIVKQEGSDTPYFQADDGSNLAITIFDTKFDNLSSFLSDLDKTNQTAWEGKPGKKIISTEKIFLSGLPAVRRIEDWLAADYTTVNTYLLINRQVYSFYIVPTEIPYDHTGVYQKYQQVLDSFEPLSTPTSFVCPQTEWVDCMPGPDKPSKTECSSEFLQWAQSNCPNFKGAAL